MEVASLKHIKDELNLKSKKELVDLCLHLGRFSKENKELMTYLLFEAQDEEGFINGMQKSISEQFENYEFTKIYTAKKNIRKILRDVKKHIRYSKKKETEVTLLIHFCKELKLLGSFYMRDKVIKGIYDRQVVLMQKAVAGLHEDLQFDFTEMIEAL